MRAVAARPEVRRARRGHALHLRPRLLQEQGQAALAGLVLRAARSGRRAHEELSQTVVDDRSGRVLESWTGYKVEWTMARGYAGAFGRVANALWVWLPLCALFVLPFARPPLRLLHLDLAVLLAFSVSYAFFNASRDRRLGPARLSAARLPARAHARDRVLAGARARAAAAAPDRAGRGARDRGGVHPRRPQRAQRRRLERDRRRLRERDRRRPLRRAASRVYGHFPPDNSRGDTYGPVLYYAYVPFEALLPWSGTWDDLPAAHAAAVAFDLLTAAGLWLLGRRLRGPDLGALLAYAWATFPFTLLVANSNANDGLVALLVTAAMLALARPAARGARRRRGRADEVRPDRAGAAVRDLPRRRGRRAPRVIAVTAAAFAAVAALALAPVALGDGLGTFYDRTLGFQADRGSPFSVWGLYDVPGRSARARRRARRSPWSSRSSRAAATRSAVAALGAAALIALQLALEHWFYLYLVWFLPLALVALLSGPQDRLDRLGADGASRARCG